MLTGTNGSLFLGDCRKDNPAHFLYGVKSSC